MPIPVELTDDFTGTDGDPWDAAVWTTRNVLLTSAAPSIDGNAGHMVATPVSTNDARVIAYPAAVFDDVDVTVRFTALDALTGFAEVGYRVGTGVTSGTPANGYVIQIAPLGDTVTLHTIPSYDTILAVHGQPIDNNDPWMYRIRAKGDHHQIKWWPADDDEPLGWKIDLTDVTYTSGQVFLGLYSTTAHTEMNVEWDDFHLVELLAPDPGFRLATEPVTAIKIGVTDVVTAWYGGVEVPVTWP